MAKLKYDARRRRALNIVWDVSWDYHFDPDFVAYGENGVLDLYLNAVVGLTRKYYDVKLIHQMFEEMEDSALVDTFTDLFWLGLEYCTYAREIPVRPVLKYLREQHARAYFDGTKLDKQGVAHEMQAARWHEVLGEKRDLHDPWAKGLYEGLCFDPSWTTQQLCDHFKKLTKKYFVSHFLVRESLEKVIISKGLGDLIDWLLPHISRKQESVFNFLYSKKQALDILSGKKAHNSLMDIITGQTQVENYQYIVDCFGASIYPPQKMLDIEQAWCSGPHRGCHLHFTRGRLGSKGTTGGEASRWLEGAHQQRVKNVAYYKDHGEQCRKSIAKLTGQLRSVMRMSRAKLPIPSKEGELVPGLVWRALKVNDDRVFFENETVSTPDFTIDLMLDASASRGEYQQVIASQAYVIAESLRQCGIPYQVYSFCTLRDYTVLTLFKEYSDKKRCTSIFNYVATGWNRDGLALRGARQLMGDFTHTRKILIMLTDAEPNDDKPLMGDGLFSSAEYRDEKAVANTADEAASLRREGIRVIGLINGENRHIMSDARKIFGRDCVEVRDLDKMADSVGKILCRHIEAL